MNIFKVYKPFIRYFRTRRKRLFHEVMKPAPNQRILDVGGYHWFWTGMECKNPITCLNLQIPPMPIPPPPQFSYVQGDGRNLPYAGNEYDIVFSNSVIEHVGTFEDQKRFAEEIRRVGKSYWVQTPNRYFPVETHLIAPFIHFLPRSLQKHLIRWLTVWGWATRPAPAQIDAFLSEVRLLTEKEMHALFPDAQIVFERFLGLKKSFIAVKAQNEISIC